MLNDFKIRLVRCLTATYLRLPVKPFHGTLARLFMQYRRGSRKKVVIAKIDGIMYSLDLNEAIDSYIYHTGTYEPMTVAFVDKFLKPGMTAVDIGANIGWYALRFARLVEKNGNVIAFEPMSRPFLKLKHNVELNDFKNVFPEKLALSDNTTTRESCFFHSWSLDGGGLPTAAHNEESIDFITLDEYATRNHLDRIDLIKLDVEGFEYKVIQGGSGTIRSLKPTMIIELNRICLAMQGCGLEALLDLLGSLGYSFHSEKDGRRYGSRESLLKAVPDCEAINVICQATH